MLRLYDLLSGGLFIGYFFLHLNNQHGTPCPTTKYIAPLGW